MKNETMTYEKYCENLDAYFGLWTEDDDFRRLSEIFQKEIEIISEINPDPAIPLLESLYCPKNYSEPWDPVCMLRSMLLMTLMKENGITAWVRQTRAVPLIAVLCGFSPYSTPGTGTYYDFMDRVIRGPRSEKTAGEAPKEGSDSGRYLRSLKGEKEAKKENRDPHQSQSEKLAEELLADADESRVENFRKVLEDLLVLIGVIPSIDAGLLEDLENLTVHGDGSIFASGASPRGQAACDCLFRGIANCGHPRYYTSATAEWCYDHAHDVFVFGDRYYHIVATQNGHDFPLITYMGAGNESDYTLSLKAADRLIKIIAEHRVPARLAYFCGDGHHDSYAHYYYLLEKGIVPVIPLAKESKAVSPHLPDSPKTKFDKNGVPLCPGGKPMRRHGFDKKKNVHVFNCPAKCPTRKKGKYVYVTDEEKCPAKELCDPKSSMGPFVRIRTDTDPRLFPPLPRDSKKFKEIMKQRSGSERCNALNDRYVSDRVHRSAERNFFRLILANIIIHAAIRHTGAAKKKLLPKGKSPPPGKDPPAKPAAAS